ncbi:MAG: phospholipase D-like domain-containing protein [Candidatus Peribacteria bacterium]|jgi:phosphatidylserine/phosphatidylglycerophosphate/cardiolipin synthase-like enzyme|nr:phospholipase D-like domain-containing protein [Candidatus Peribacteria bacterium]
MNKEKIVTFMIISSFLTIFSLFYSQEYIDFQNEKIEIINEEKNFQEENNNFKISDIKEITNIDIITTPNKALLEEIVEIIDNAEKYVYVEVYMLTENRIKEAILRAKKRNVDIKIILEKDPYLAYNINNKAFDEFSKKQIDVVWSNKSNYELNHSKIILTDGLSIIST